MASAVSIVFLLIFLPLYQGNLSYWCHLDTTRLQESRKRDRWYAASKYIKIGVIHLWHNMMQ